jgi:hypothetical protein
VHLRSFMVLLASLAILTGCGSSEFDEGAVKGQLEGTPQSLSNEQVTLTDGLVDCGAKNELWDPPSGNVARLLQKGRDLKFSDDVRLNDPEIGSPYIQVSGTFPVSVTDVSKLREAGAGYKLVDVKLGITVANECFPAPLQLMGIKKGKFTPGAPVVFRFKGSEKEWSLDKLMH